MLSFAFGGAAQDRENLRRTYDFVRSDQALRRFSSSAKKTGDPTREKKKNSREGFTRARGNSLFPNTTIKHGRGHWDSLMRRAMWGSLHTTVEASGPKTYYLRTRRGREEKTIRKLGKNPRR